MTLVPYTIYSIMSRPFIPYRGGYLTREKNFLGKFTMKYESRMTDSSEGACMARRLPGVLKPAKLVTLQDIAARHLNSN